MSTRRPLLPLLLSPLLLGAGGFSDTCSELTREIQLSYAEEKQVSAFIPPYPLSPAEKRDFPAMKAHKLKTISTLRKQRTAEAKQLNCAIPAPPSPEELDLLMQEVNEKNAKSQQPPAPTAKNDGSSNVIADFTKRFPELECRNWSFTARPNEGTSSVTPRMHYTVIARTRKKTKLDGLDYPANSNLFLEGLSEDLSIFDSSKKVFRRIRIISRN